MCRNLVIAVIILSLVGGGSLFFTSPVIKYLLEDVRVNMGSCQGKYFGSSKKLFNVYGEEIFAKSYDAPADVLRGYPWLGQYIFGGARQPYCHMNINPFYGGNVTWTEYTGTNADMLTEGSILQIIGKLDDTEYVFYNRDGFIVIDKVDGKYFPRGFYGYKSTL